MMIQNVPVNGIKLGRGHDCEIRITDISVSRNHALIKNANNSFYIFDNKSKFGTLVKDEKLSVEIGRLSRGVQIGRTALNF
jgi:pSer/pThr/pTyr-binding forkhead associated (FHA) protein